MNTEQTPTPSTTQPVMELTLPKPHLLTRLVDANETYFIASRGSWKTSRGISLFLIRKVYEMPKSSGVLVGLSFEHLGDNTLPPLLHALEGFGFVHGEHYVVGKKPPSSWPRPLLGVINDKWDNTIAFHNGTVMHLISLKKKASANGISAQWGIFDEAKFMSEKVLKDEIFPIFRGNEKHFQHLGGYLSKFFATDKLADPVQIKWILKKQKLNDPRRIQLVIDLAIHLNKLRQEFNGAGKNRQQKLKPTIHNVERRLDKLRAGMVFYCEANALDVLPVMGKKWLEDKRRNMGKREFAVGIMNEDPTAPGEMFYPDFNSAVNTYTEPHDINPIKKFIITADYQHSVAPIPVAQLTKLPGAGEITLNYVDEVYTLEDPKEEPQPNGNGKQGGLDDAVDLFCTRYRNHHNKRVDFVYDHTAIGRRAGADEFYKIVERALKRNKWKVRHVYTGHAPSHFQKFNDTKEWLQHKDKSVPAIMINRDRCKKLITSITGAPAITTGGKTEKDKKSEKKPELDQSETTHFSDTFDMINHAVLKLKMIKPNTAKLGVGVR